MHCIRGRWHPSSYLTSGTFEAELWALERPEHFLALGTFRFECSFQDRDPSRLLPFRRTFVNSPCNTIPPYYFITLLFHGSWAASMEPLPSNIVGCRASLARKHLDKFRRFVLAGEKTFGGHTWRALNLSIEIVCSIRTMQTSVIWLHTSNSIENFCQENDINPHFKNFFWLR